MPDRQHGSALQVLDTASFVARVTVLRPTRCELLVPLHGLALPF